MISDKEMQEKERKRRGGKGEERRGEEGKEINCNHIL